MSELAMNIDDFHIGQSIKDKDNSVCIVTDKYFIVLSEKLIKKELTVNNGLI